MSDEAIVSTTKTLENKNKVFFIADFFFVYFSERVSLSNLVAIYYSWFSPRETIVFVIYVRENERSGCCRRLIFFFNFFCYFFFIHSRERIDTALALGAMHLRCSTYIRGGMQFPVGYHVRRLLV